MKIFPKFDADTSQQISPEKKYYHMIELISYPIFINALKEEKKQKAKKREFFFCRTQHNK